MSVLSNFYNHLVFDSQGRLLKEIWEWTDDELESTHDYIQWLFPLREDSICQPDSPILTDRDIAVIDKENVRRSFLVMCDFYGIEYQGVTIRTNPHTWIYKHHNWLRPKNHNYLRLTRIIKSLMLFGLEQEAVTLEMFLVDLYSKHKDMIGEETLKFWTEAI